MGRRKQREGETDEAFAAYLQTCGEKQRAANARWRAANREKERAQQAIYRAANPEKERTRNARWRAENPEKVRATRVRYRAEKPEMGRSAQRARGKGITAAGVREILAANDGTCDVCGTHISPRRDGSDGRHIDHRHDNGAVRGVLCARCNRAAGVLDLDPEYLAKLAAYCTRGAPVP